MDLKILQEPADTGIAQMNRDMLLLEDAEDNHLGPTLRFYQWSAPTVSLGLHQKSEVLDLKKLEESQVPWVYRPTGGAAVLHSEELTYAVVFPNAASSEGSAKVQEFVGRAITKAFNRLGINATLDERGEPLAALPNRNSCFVRTSRWEVTVNSKKIVGSAQRKLRNAILQHGSILIGNDHLRLIDFLQMQSESARSMLKERLINRSTCITKELKREVDVHFLRETLAESFHHEYKNIAEGFTDCNKVYSF